MTSEYEKIKVYFMKLSMQKSEDKQETQGEKKYEETYFDFTKSK